MKSTTTSTIKEPVETTPHSPVQSGESLSDTDGESDQDEMESKFANLRLRRTDSISKYKAKQLLKLQKKEEGEDEEDEDEGEGDGDEEESGGAQSAGDEQEDKQTATSSPPPEKRTVVPAISLPPSSVQAEVKKKRASLDSDDENFGYDDNIQFRVVRRQSPRSEGLRPINNPIPKRPILQVDPSKEIINLSLIALRTTVRIGFDKIDTLTQNDFIHFKKYRVSLSEKKTIIKDFSPNVFNILRNRLNIDPTEFLKSWSSYINLNDQTKPKSKNIKQPLTPTSSSLSTSSSSASLTTSSSSEFLVYSSDKKYIMKVISKSDSVKLRTLLPHYYNYLIYNPNSFLDKYLGLFRIGNKSNHSYVVILYNLYESHIQTNEVLTASGHSTSTLSLKKPKTPLKKLKLDSSVKHSIYKQIEKDVTFLSSQDLMDYGLNIGILNNKNPMTDLESSLKIDRVDIVNSNSLNNSSNNTPVTENTASTGNSITTPPVLSGASSTTPQTVLPAIESVISSPLTSSTGNGALIDSPSSTPPLSPHPGRVPYSDLLVLDPIKTVPRLLYFIENIETDVKSNNVKISKSLKKSFAALPRSWSLEDIKSIDQSKSTLLNPNIPELMMTPPSSPPTVVIVTSNGVSSPSPSPSPSSSFLNSPSQVSSPLAFSPITSKQFLPSSISSSLGSSLGNLPTLPSLSSSSNSVVSSPLSTTPATAASPSNPKYLHKHTIYQSTDDQETYYFGVIDFLTKKKITSTNPSQYLRKFLSNTKDNYLS